MRGYPDARTCLGCIGNPLSTPGATTSPDPADHQVTFAYDYVGNRLTQVDYLGTTGYTYDTADRLTTVDPPGPGTTNYGYDPNGNETSAGTSTFTYDLADRLASASVGATSQTYTYAGDGVRLSSTQGTSTTQFLTDRAFGLPQTALERDGAGSLFRRYAYGLDLLGQQDAGAADTYVHTDGLGSVTDETSAQGASLVWTAYNPFGAARSQGIAQGVTPSAYGFTGERADPTGLLYLRAREYDPGTGRFLGTDPVTKSLGAPYSSRYVYTEDSPTRLRDPGGTESKGSPAFADLTLPALVYLIYEGGKVIYVGITNDPDVRGAYWARLGYRIVVKTNLMARPIARGIEQRLLERFGLQKQGGDLMNKINSIAQTNDAYEASTSQADEYLRGEPIEELGSGGPGETSAGEGLPRVGPGGGGGGRRYLN